MRGVVDIPRHWEFITLDTIADFPASHRFAIRPITVGGARNTCVRNDIRSITAAARIRLSLPPPLGPTIKNNVPRLIAQSTPVTLGPTPQLDEILYDDSSVLLCRRSHIYASLFVGQNTRNDTARLKAARILIKIDPRRQMITKCSQIPLLTADYK